MFVPEIPTLKHRNGTKGRPKAKKYNSLKKAKMASSWFELLYNHGLMTELEKDICENYGILRWQVLSILGLKPYFQKSSIYSKYKSCVYVKDRSLAEEKNILEQWKIASSLLSTSEQSVLDWYILEPINPRLSSSQITYLGHRVNPIIAKLKRVYI